MPEEWLWNVASWLCWWAMGQIAFRALLTMYLSTTYPVQDQSEPTDLTQRGHKAEETLDDPPPTPSQGCRTNNPQKWKTKVRICLSRKGVSHFGLFLTKTTGDKWLIFYSAQQDPLNPVVESPLYAIHIPRSQLYTAAGNVSQSRFVRVNEGLKRHSPSAAHGIQPTATANAQSTRNKL